MFFVENYLPEMIYASLSTLGDVFTLALICLVGFVGWFVLTTGTRYWKRYSLPYIEGKPFAGNFLDALLLRKSNFELMDRLYNDAKVAGSKLFGISILMQPAVVLRDPEIIKQILIKDAPYFSNRYCFFSLVELLLFKPTISNESLSCFGWFTKLDFERTLQALLHGDFAKGFTSDSVELFCFSTV